MPCQLPEFSSFFLFAQNIDGKPGGDPQFQNGDKSPCHNQRRSRSMFKKLRDQQSVKNGITGRSAGAAIDFGFEILKGLGLESEAETVKAQIIY